MERFVLCLCFLRCTIACDGVLNEKNESVQVMQQPSGEEHGVYLFYERDGLLMATGRQAGSCLCGSKLTFLFQLFLRCGS